jgi:hypothetical protein
MYIPPSESKALQNLKRWGIIHHTKKPDGDNLEKFYLDAGSGILWRDDSAIVDLRIYKRYDQCPKTIIRLSPMPATVCGTAQKILALISPDDLDDLVEKVLLLQHCRTILAENDPFDRPTDDETLSQCAAILLDLSSKHGRTLLNIAKIGNNL